MSADMNWIIGGLTPVHITADVIIDNEKRTITLNCAAVRTKMNGTDPYIEIARFQALSSYAINNNIVNNAGTNLQVSSGDPIFSVTNGVDVWERCALHPPIITYDEFADDFLLFQLIIEFEVQRGGGFAVYKQPFNVPFDKYPNMEYYYFYDPDASPKFKSNSPDQGDIAGTEFGWIKIIEEQLVKQVQIYGAGCELPSALTVEGSEEVTINWTYGEFPGSAKLTGTQILTFNMIEPTTDIIMHTTPHMMDRNHGCDAIWIKTVFV